MDTEIEAIENLEEQLKEELSERNFHLAPAVKFPEERYRPAAGKYALMALANLVVLAAGAAGVYLLASDLSPAAAEYLDNFFSEVEEWQVQLALFVAGMLVLLRLFSGRIAAFIRAWYLLGRTEYLLSSFYLMVKTRTFKVRTRFVPYSSISDMIVRQRLIDRLFNYGDIVILQKKPQIGYASCHQASV